MILLIDNYDSFVHNLARYFNQLGQQTVVLRNDAVTLEMVHQLAPDAVVLSPGPCTPDQAGISLDLVRQLSSQLPMLGICLGHQVIAQALGGSIIQASQPVHGQSSPVRHDGKGVFRDLPNPLTVCRYHSLVVDRPSIPASLQVSCWLDDDTVMGIRHRELPLVGVQFHPESVLTEGGYQLLAQFLELAGLAATSPIPLLESEQPSSTEKAGQAERPVTF
ncbi:MAG: aminodeoxychorismate/anthranilate synthase component II [Pirellulaceae bacterium]|jgi:anthranilate synthase/aminodeoxychorismate synthase-like glutamine amidotransferase|nr:aminodeoxychorismate/anthranilate synthase component II [Pirellulaceae bacterium]